MVMILASGVHIWAQTLCSVSGTKRNTQNKHVALTNEFHSPQLNLFSLAIWSFPSWPVVTVKCMKGGWDVWLQCLLNVSETLSQTNTNSFFIYCISCTTWFWRFRGLALLHFMGKPMSSWWNLTKTKQNIKQTTSLEVSFSNKHTQTHLKTGGCLQFGFGRLLAVSF